MDLKLGFCALSLSLLILLVTYGTEARKMAEGSLQGKRLNFPVADEVVFKDLENKEDNHSWIYNNQGEIAQHRNGKSEENRQVQISSENKNKEDIHTWIYNNQGEIAQHVNGKSEEENRQVQLSSKKTKENIHTWIYNNQGEIAEHRNGKIEEENRQVQLSSENKEDIYTWIYNSQDETAQHRNSKNEEENRQVQLSSENKEDIHMWIYNNQGEIAQHINDKSEKENRQVQISSENKENIHTWIYNNQDEIAQQRNGKSEKENHQVQLSSENKEDNHFWIYDKLGETNHQEPKKENEHLRVKQGDNNHQLAKNDNAHVHSSSHMAHMDHSLRVFFLIDDLKLGKSLNVHFARRDLSHSPSFLPREEADSIPFSLKELPNLLQSFSFSRNSPQGIAMEDTLRECEVPPIKGETKYCATSSEAMLDFVQGIMGDRVQIKALTTTHFANSTPLLQKYTISDVPEEIPAPKMVACHTMPYAYAIFYCHYTVSKSKVFKVSLVGENGDRVKAIAVCHLDTSEWSPKHVSFRVLGVLPGASPICHFFPSDNLVWVPKIAAAQDH